jgi:hypothetical protein
MIWNAYGQTTLNANTGYDDLAPSVSLALPGDCPSLPYIVPPGKQLSLIAWGIEGYDTTGIVVIFPWIERPDDQYFNAAPQAGYPSSYRATRSFCSCASLKGTNELIGARHVVPSGYKVHVRHINGSAYGGMYGWYVRGELEDAV